ncbi:phage shock protein C (PspC) family protein [Carnobacterium iners]|uniref:Phage shock protein C (PspC) family protein n=1 Tax=Carnobacterium iners TaxID=1073423 RepID=A0A1X7MPU4_9LACT|nr:PspC domain-containing protein [Carnobacterium iners]SEK86753.1 phage shock protein C (PspC) family protein [Carnobacterium iners]SMH26859.1 phage shock protein C (PspC) family protein [Carnobacterium iners]
MKKITKSKNNRVISGVLGGIAEYFDFDPSFLRIIYAIAIVFGVGSPIILYVILALVIPEAPGSAKSDWHHSFNEKKNENRPRKEAEKVSEDKKKANNDWSDF